MYSFSLSLSLSLSLKVTTIEFKDNVLKVAETRNDEWGKAVVKRLLPIFDAVAADASYHRDCFTLFFKKTERKSTYDYIDFAMNDVFEFLENSDDCQFSMEEILEQIKGYAAMFRQTLPLFFRKIFLGEVITKFLNFN